MRIAIPVYSVEAEIGGNTMWVHSPKGATVLRVKCSGVIHTDACINVVPHMDLEVEGDIHLRSAA